MLRSKLGLLGLCVMAVGLMAFASSAQAAVNWLVLEKDEKTVHTGGELKATLTGTLENETGSLLALIVKLYIKILCTKGTLSNTTLDANGALSPGGSVTFEGCKTYNAGLAKEPEIEGCTPHTPGTEPGTVKSNKGKAQLQSNGRTLVESEKQVKEGEKTVGEFATLEFNEETCVLPGVTPVKGTLLIQDCENLAAAHLATHLIEEVKEIKEGKREAPHTLWVGAHNTEHLEMTELDGSANVSLAGTHVGLKWGAVFP